MSILITIPVMMNERASSTTSIKVCASAPRRPRTMSRSSLLEKIASIREGSSPGAKARPIKRLQAGVLELRKQRQSVFSERS